MIVIIIVIVLDDVSGNSVDSLLESLLTEYRDSRRLVVVNSGCVSTVKGKLLVYQVIH